MNHHGHSAVSVLKVLPQIRVIIFKFPGKCLGQAIYPFRMDKGVVRGTEPVPAQGSGILPIFIKLAIQTS